jgi:hypothetical protein
MIRHHYLLRALILCLASMSLAPDAARAEYPAACYDLQTCVDQGVSGTLAACLAANSACDLTSFKANQSTDRFAASSNEIADRAILNRKCAAKTRKFACNLCYQRAKEILKFRFDGAIFHGLLGNATQLIEKKRKEVCSTLP